MAYMGDRFMDDRYMGDRFREERFELPSMHEVFYGRSEPTFILNNQQPMIPHRYPPPHRGEMVRPLQDYPQDLPPPGYRTKALVGPQNGAVSRIMHQSPGLVLRVPMCCENCIEKVRMSLMGLSGVRGVVCDQYEQKVVISGDVLPEEALRRVRRVKRKSMFWNMATQPLKFTSGHGSEVVRSRPLISSYQSPSSYSTSAYRAPSSGYSGFVSPPRQYRSSYSQAPYNNPYIDSAYRSGYGERRHGGDYFNRFGYGEPRQDSFEYVNGAYFYSAGTPFMAMNDGAYN